MEITEDRPMSYTAADGARIELRVAGPERVFTLTVSGERMLTTLNEDYARTMARREAEAHNARMASQPAPAQMASPLPVNEQRSSGLAGGGAAANAMSWPMARIMSEALDWWAGTVRRGRHCPETATTGLRNMRAMARRGWLELDHPIRPTLGTVTDAGRRALAAELARTGGAR